MPIDFRSGASSQMNYNNGPITVAKPAGVAAGDVLVAVTHFDSAVTGHDVSSEWTLLSMANNQQYIWFRVAGASEPASYSWAYTGVRDWSVVVSAYTGVDNTSPVDAHAQSLEQKVNNIVAPSVTTGTKGARVVCTWSVQGQYELTPEAALTTRAYSPPTVNVASTTLLADMHQTSAGATGDRIATKPAGTASCWGSTVALKALNTAPSAPGAFTSPTSGVAVDTSATVAAGAASDPDGDVLSYQWDLSFDNGSTYTNKRATQAGLSWTYNYANDPETSTAKWRVRAWDGQAWGPYTYAANFTISHGSYMPALIL